jgi:predicted  nucleic acid-binding Zn ribbon protein
MLKCGIREAFTWSVSSLNICSPVSSRESFQAPMRMRAHFNLTETKVITKLHKKFIRSKKGRSRCRYLTVEGSITLQSMLLSIKCARSHLSIALEGLFVKLFLSITRLQFNIVAQKFLIIAHSSTRASSKKTSEQ